MTDDLPYGVFLRDGKPVFTWQFVLEVLLGNDRPISILARVCDSNRCLELARYETHWPGQDGVKCERCTARAKEIATAMGFTLQVDELPLPIAFATDDSALRFALMELD